MDAAVSRPLNERGGHALPDHCPRALGSEPTRALIQCLHSTCRRQCALVLRPARFPARSRVVVTGQRICRRPGKFQAVHLICYATRKTEVAWVCLLAFQGWIMQEKSSATFSRNHPRIPPEHDGVQVNHCKSPICANYGVPAGQSSVRGRNSYILDSRNKGISSCICASAV